MYKCPLRTLSISFSVKKFIIVSPRINYESTTTVQTDEFKNA
jgi:hypothetical protein